MRDYRGKTEDKINPNYMPPRFLDEDESYNVPPMIDGEWVYGGYCELEKLCLIIPDTASLCYGVKIIDEHDFLEGFIEVIPSSVGQSTGLKDKNGDGKESYGKDICLYKDDSGTMQEGVIEWCDCQARYYLEAIGGDDEGNQDGDLDRWFDILGNTTDDPKLMEAKE